MAEKSRLQIAQFIKEMKFRKVPFGVSKEDALSKIHELNRLYQAAWEEEEQERRHSEQNAYQEKVETLTATLMQIKKDGEATITQAKREKEEIILQAQAQAKTILEEALSQAEDIKMEAYNEAGKITVEAKSEAERVTHDAHRMLTEARAESEKVMETAKYEVEKVMGEVQNEAQKSVNEAREETQRVLLERKEKFALQQEDMNREIDKLKTVHRILYKKLQEASRLLKMFFSGDVLINPEDMESETYLQAGYKTNTADSDMAPTDTSQLNGTKRPPETNGEGIAAIQNSIEEIQQQFNAENPEPAAPREEKSVFEKITELSQETKERTHLEFKDIPRDPQKMIL